MTNASPHQLNRRFLPSSFWEMPVCALFQKSQRQKALGARWIATQKQLHYFMNKDASGALSGKTPRHFSVAKGSLFKVLLQCYALNQ